MIEQAKLDTRVSVLLTTLYGKRFNVLSELKLERLLQKNPYLYCSLGLNNPSDFIEQVLIAFVSSSDETVFGNDFFEPLAIWAAEEADQHGQGNRTVTVGAGAGQDIAIETVAAYYAISVKSGKNIFNAQSNKGQNAEFDELRARLKKLNKQFVPVIGYGYGRKMVKKASSTEKIAGQKFWSLLTGEQDFYLRIASAIQSVSGVHGAQYKVAFDKKRNELLRQFMLNFVSDAGEILWQSIVEYNSSIAKAPRLCAAAEQNDAP